MLTRYQLDGGDITLKAMQKLPQETQQDILDYLRDCPLYETVNAGGKDFISEHGMLNSSAINTIMREEKPNQKEKVHIPYNEIRQYIPREVSFEKTADYIKKALEFYQQNRPRGSKSKST